MKPYLWIGAHARAAGCIALCTLALLLSSRDARSATCSLSATGAAFGAYLNVLNESAVATISGTCSRGNGADPDMTAATVSLSPGTSASYTTRQLAQGVNRLNYNLYTSAARAVVWGDGTGGTATVAGLAVQGNGRFLNVNSSRNFSLSAYGRIPADQFVALGSYSDTITVTITY